MGQPIDPRTIDDALSALMPPEGALLVVTGDIDIALGERLAAGRAAIRRTPSSFSAEEALAAQPDLGVCVLREPIAGFDQAGGTLQTLAAAGLPTIVTFTTPSPVEQDDPGIASGAAALGFRATAAAIPAEGLTSFLLLPSGEITNAAWWRSQDGQRFVKRRRKRGERMLADDTMRDGAVVWRSSPKWEDRSVVVASLIPDDLAVLDLGCGKMFIERHLRMRAYAPLDRMAHDERTLVVDMNHDDLPTDALAAADLVIALGVFEYVVDPERQFRTISAAGKPFLLSYNVGELRRRDAGDAQLTDWRNDWTTVELIQRLIASGFALERLIDYGPRQRILVAIPRAGDRRDWWSRLGAPKT